MWIDISGSKFNTDHIAVVRPIDDDDDQCVIFTVGQSATDQGFLVELGIDEVFAMIQSARLIEISRMLGDETAGERTSDSEAQVEAEETEQAD